MLFTNRALPLTYPHPMRLVYCRCAIVLQYDGSSMTSFVNGVRSCVWQLDDIELKAKVSS